MRNKNSSIFIIFVFFHLFSYGQTLTSDISATNNESRTSSVTSPISDKGIIDEIPQLVQSTGGGGIKGLSTNLENKASNFISSEGIKILNNFFTTTNGTTEISATSMENYLPKYNILLLRPINESSDNNLTFTQMSIFNQDSRTTANLGLGYRKFVADKKILLGTNAFYDYEFPYGNQRTSVGGEIRSSIGDLNFNYYVGTSGWVDAANGYQEKSLGGYNIELAITLPYLPSSHFRVNSFQWNGVSGLNNTSGTQYSLTSALWGGMNIDIGRYLYNDSVLPNSNYAKIYWIFDGEQKKNKQQFQITEYAYKFVNIESRRYEKVRRENQIVKAVRAGSYTVGVIGY